MDKIPNRKVLIWDIETTSIDIDKAELRYFAGYSYITGKRYFYKETEIDSIKQIINAHEVHVGYNLKNYDIPVLNKYGIFFTYMTIIDLWEILSPPKLNPKTRIRTGGKGRGAFMGLDLNSWSLSNVVKALNLGEYKDDAFDYKILAKPSADWTDTEFNIIHEYTNQDITITKRLFEYTNNFFFPLTEFLSGTNITKYKYLSSSIASLSYKVICHVSGLPETYGDGNINTQYEGGYVRYPIQEKATGNILCMDFNSLYPSIFRGFNLFSHDLTDYDGPTFAGNDFFKIKGTYRADKLGPVEQTVATLYKLRKKWKSEGDKREYLIKIIINSIYGAAAKPVFEQVFSPHGAEDCTAIGRQMIKYVADRFDESGFIVLYGDTDSVYVQVPDDKTTEQALALAKECDTFLLSKMPFPHTDFGLGLDEEIKAMFFFDDGLGHYKKKNYVYITQKDKLKIKGLPIIKSNASKIATRIFDEYLRKQIIEKLDIKFPEGYVKQLIYHELEKDLGLAIQVYKTKPYDEYDATTSLYAQISQKYGDGVHELVPNHRIGLGKGKQYCTVQEFRDGNGQVEDIDLSVTLSNLEPFMKSEQRSLGDFHGNV